MKDKRRLLVFLIPFVWWGLGHIFRIIVGVNILNGINPYYVDVSIGGIIIFGGILSVYLLIFQVIPQILFWIFEKKNNGNHA